MNVDGTISERGNGDNGPSARYQAVGNKVFDTAWADPTSGHVTAGVRRDKAIFTFDSEADAAAAAASRNACC